MTCQELIDQLNKVVDKSQNITAFSTEIGECFEIEKVDQDPNMGLAIVVQDS